jgi:UDP-N-acetylmuramyl pentapeptide phosphotransferase/UDP-N-acetylglucosamine-1-phosphate transferase
MEYSLLLHDGVIMGGFFLLSCIISYLCIPFITRIAEKNHLFDRPDNNRKLHSRAVPTLGGSAIFFAFLLSFSVSPWADSMPGYSYLVGALVILLFVGLKDDLIELSARTKLISQITAGGLVVFGSGALITNFHGVLGLAHIPYWAAVPVSVVVIIAVINAVNLIDGIDGLAGGIGAIASALFGGAFLYVGQVPLAMFSFCLTGALIGFLYYNFSPATIFMGDTGSMILGFLLAVQSIEFIKLSNHPEFSAIFTNTAPILAVSILAFPLFDTLRVIFKRFRRNKSIIRPGQDHVHHELLRMGFSHKSASLMLYGQSLSLIALMGCLATFNININILLSVLVLASMLVFPTNGFKRKLVSGLFGVDWSEYRSPLWGIEFGHHSIGPSNGNGASKDFEYEMQSNGNGEHKREEEEMETEEAKEREIENIAV